jgi:hypothetical protein
MKNTRFIDNGDGTVTDSVTGLMWVKDGKGTGCNNEKILGWQKAMEWTKGLNFAGYNDWRIPGIHELHSIVDYERSYPAIDPIFTNTRFNCHWSSTTYANNIDFAWVIYFTTGIVTGNNKNNSYYVRPVRGNK